MLVKTGRIAALQFVLDVAVSFIIFRLFQNDFAGGNANAEMEDLEEADFAGYVAKSAVAFPVPIINGDGDGETESATLTWTAGALAGDQTIYGIYATVIDPDSEEEVLLWYDRFASPTTLHLPGQTVDKKVKMLDTNYAPE